MYCSANPDITLTVYYTNPTYYDFQTPDIMPLGTLKWLAIFSSRDLTNRSFSESYNWLVCYVCKSSNFFILSWNAHVGEFDFNFAYEKKKLGKAFGYVITEDVNTVCHGFRVVPLWWVRINIYEV